MVFDFRRLRMKWLAPILLFMVFFSSCNSKGKDKKPLVHAYYYYPRPNVYYDTAIKSFIFFDTTTKSWKSGNLPAYLQSDLGKSVFIDTASQPVWSANKEHQLLYSATLYADSSDFKKRPEPKPEVADKSLDQKTDNSPPREKKKTKIGEIIKKIFGRRKD